MEGFTAERLAQAFAAFRDRLLALAQKRLNPILLRRFAYEDILQETYAAAVKRLSFFNTNPEVPLYFKFRTILLQTIADLERRKGVAGSRWSWWRAQAQTGTTSGVWSRWLRSAFAWPRRLAMRTAAV